MSVLTDTGDGATRAGSRRWTLKERREIAIKEGWPTEAAYKVANDACGEAFAEVEAIQWRIRHLLPDVDEDGKGGGYEWFDRVRPYPTIVDIGHFYSFVEDLELDVETLASAAKELRALLVVANAERREAPERRKDGDA